MLCFTASYLVALLLEISRLVIRARIRTLVTAVAAGAGLLAHTIYLFLQAKAELRVGSPLSSWYDWCLLVAWVLAAVYLILSLRNPSTALGMFMLPLVLVMIGVAYTFREVAPFPPHEASRYWYTIHGVALLLGTVVVMIGVVAGLMYLLQSYRLKHKLRPSEGFRLPSLEWLQRLNSRSLLVSTGLLAVGLVSGVVLNLIKQARHASGVPWSDPVVYTSGGLLLWLLAVVLFEWLYKPARQGSKVAYLTLASFIFLGLVLGIVLFGSSEHALPKASPQQSRSFGSKSAPPLASLPPVVGRGER